MKVDRIEIGETGLFSPIFLDYINQKKALQPFYNLFPLKENIGKQIKLKQESFSSDTRKVLSTSLKSQYEGIVISDNLASNLNALEDENTFTITTGHQLNIFTGPLYFIYKIVTVINACKELKADYPKYNFVPVYWMASEDHDFEEISYFTLFEKKYSWETDQTGAVGRFDPRTLDSILKEMPGTNTLFKKAYLEHENLADAVRYYVNEIFGDEGLVVVDGDDHSLKKLFSGAVEDELSNQSSYEEVGKQTDLLIKAGYKPQISSREINLFYLADGVRERIVKDDNQYRVLNSDLSFSKEEIIDLVRNEPEKFSPNVILRPLYQELILPNLAYVGGPAEVVYWLQLKAIFDHNNTPFPILLPRNFVQFVDHVAARKLQKTKLKTSEIFVSNTDLIEKKVMETTKHDLELGQERKEVEILYNIIRNKAEAVDTTLDELIKAETKRIFNSLDKIEKKMIKSEKRQFEDYSRQVEDLMEMLYPGGKQQERSQNFLNFYLDDPNFIEKIKSGLSPFDLRYHVILDEQE